MYIFVSVRHSVPNQNRRKRWRYWRNESSKTYWINFCLKPDKFEVFLSSGPFSGKCFVNGSSKEKMKVKGMKKETGLIEKLGWERWKKTNRNNLKLAQKSGKNKCEEFFQLTGTYRVKNSKALFSSKLLQIFVTKVFNSIVEFFESKKA